MATREQNLEAENYTLKMENLALKSADGKERRTFWLEAIKLFMSFLNPVITALVVYLSYISTHTELEANKVDRMRIEEKVDEVKVAATEAAVRTDEVREAVKSAHEDIKNTMNR